MDINQWIQQVKVAYQLLGKPFPPNGESVLLSKILENGTGTETQVKVGAEVMDVMTRFFYKRAAQGEPFGSLSRIKEEFGSSLEENYGLSSGPFINMAKTYWTYKLEIKELFPAHHDNILSKILGKIELDIASVFFPTPGALKMPLTLRKTKQRQLLQEYAPEIDIERFLSENPILRVEASRKGCFGSIMIVVLIVLGFIIALQPIFK